ncbi:unnamed protein product [Polarella glacialis]|uniref:Tyrosine-protein kinase ephrin type A/B receptor-like domain-containing protein n=1 Tax=Polarella glacialis TaxID=89957 RepID=A0A813LD50_POLGL|nr:unnamed protein product [Polarella glacialis]
MPDVLRIVGELETRQQQLFKARNGDPPTLLGLQADPIATCGGLSPPNTCTFPQSDMQFLNRSLFQVGSRYFTLPGADGKDQRGISPLIFNGMSDFLKDPSMTSDQLLRTWACEINFVVNSNTHLCNACPAGFELGASPSQCVMCQLGEATSGTARCSSCQAGSFAKQGLGCIPCLEGLSCEKAVCRSNEQGSGSRLLDRGLLQNTQCSTVGISWNAHLAPWAAAPHNARVWPAAGAWSGASRQAWATVSYARQQM